ncbi:MAG: GTPase ObgE [Candidatus Aminicenantes bacterium]|nr:GTPase ObgE [Candidatus Aminicenantes bacterium]
MFIDQVKVILRAGKGGDGCVSFRRERGVPRGGPNGGRGGDGGSIYLVSDENVNSLAFFRFHPINKAQRGAHGQGANRHGKKGEDLYLKVPVGTIVKEKGKEDILFDFIKSRQNYLAVKGGRGGRGNASFATSTRQSPRIREQGQPGEENEFFLELKLIADVGLIGFPNVGKSTLISKISAATPVIADYPFTTLTPNLGVVDIGEYTSFVVADIPGLIKGAHKGHGLGIRFLKHIERTKLLIHLIDVSPYTKRDPVDDFHAVMKELEAFNPKLIERSQILVANKIDLIESHTKRLKKIEFLAKEKGFPFYAISALKEKGLKSLVLTTARTLDKLAVQSE